MKFLAIQSKSNPDVPGYNDYGFLIDDYKDGIYINGKVSGNCSVLWRGELSCQPNPNMFCLLKENFKDPEKDKSAWVPMTQMIEPYKIWCGRCNRGYCSNCKKTSATIDPRIACKLYGRIACNTINESYTGLVVPNHDKFGKCILLNNGGKILSVQPDSEHNGEMWCSGVFVHKGYSMTWRGSAACITIPPNNADIFFAHFGDNDTVRIEVFDYVKRIIA